MVNDKLLIFALILLAFLLFNSRRENFMAGQTGAGAVALSAEFFDSPASVVTWNPDINFYFDKYGDTIQQTGYLVPAGAIASIANYTALMKQAETLRFSDTNGYNAGGAYDNLERAFKSENDLKDELD